MAILVGPDLRYVLVNRAYQALVPDVSMVGRTLTEVFPYAAASGVEGAFRRVLETGEPWRIDRYQGPVHGRPEAVWQGEVVRLPARDGEPAIVVTAVDITDRVHAEESLTSSRQTQKAQHHLLECLVANARASIAVLRGRATGKTVGVFGMFADITERKQAEERYRALFESMSEGCVLGRMIYDEQGDAIDYQLTEANPAYERLTGVPRDESLRKTMKQLIPGLEPTWVEHHARVAETGRPEHWEAYNAHVDQHYEIYSFSPAPGLFASMFLNVTDRKRTEEALKESDRQLRLSEERFRLAVDNLPEVFVIYDRQRRFEFINAAGLRLGGLEGKDWHGKRDEDFFPPSVTDTFVPQLEEAYRAKAVRRFEATITLPGNPPYTHSITYVPILDGDAEVRQMLGLTEDVTERKRVQESLEQSGKRLSAALEVAQLGVWEYEVATAQSYYDRRCREVFGIITDRPISNNEVFDLIHPEDRPRVERDMKAALDPTGSGVYDTEYRVVHPDGAQRWLAVRGHAIRAAGDSGPARFVGTLMDVTERKRAEETIREREADLQRERAFLRTVIDAVASHVLVKDGRGRVLLANEAAARFHGLMPRDLEGTDCRSIATFPPDTCDQDRAVLESGRERTVEREAVGADGQRHFLISSLTPLRNDKGVPDRVLSTSADITWRRRAEQAQRAQAELLSAIVDNIPVLLTIWDPTLKSFQFNKHLRDVLGWTEEDAAGVDDFMACVYPDPAYREQVIDYMLAHRPGWRDLLTTAKDGTAVDISWANVQLPEGRSIGIGIEVGKRKAMEAELRRSAQMLHAIMEHVPEGVSICDADGRFVLSSKAGLALTRRLIGEDAAAYASKNRLLAADGVTPLALDELPLMRAVKRGETVIGEEVVLERWDGVCLPILCNAAPIRDESAGIVGAVLAYQDISERKRMEDTLREADRRKDEFIAVLSHELRNPLAPIRYALPILQEERFSEAAGRAMAAINRQVDHLARLVDDLLDVSRITRGKIELRREYVTLASVVQASVEAAAPVIAFGSHSLKLNVTEEPIWVHADLPRMVQVVTNLLNNSAKYTPRGGEIVLDARRDGAEAVISVRDNGLGITRDALGSIFEMFRQVNRPDGQGGLGIGLALAKRLVEMHEGRIEARSAGLGEGAEFVVRVPIAQAAANQVEVQNQDRTERRGRSLRVLVVDDNIDLTEMLAMVIETAGHHVRKAFDGRSAVSAACAYAPDVVLLDLGLPGMSGLEVAAELRRHPQTSAARLIAVTGWGQAEDRQRTSAAGFDHHLTKPTDPPSLQRLLAELAAELGG